MIHYSIMYSNTSELTIGQLQKDFFDNLERTSSVDEIKTIIGEYKRLVPLTTEARTGIALTDNEAKGDDLVEGSEDIPGMTTLIVNGVKVILSLNHVNTHLKFDKVNELKTFLSTTVKGILDNSNILKEDDKKWSINYHVKTDRKHFMGIKKLGPDDEVFYGIRDGRVHYSKLTHGKGTETDVWCFCVMTKTPDKGLIPYKGSEYSVGNEAVKIINAIFPIVEKQDVPSNEIDDILQNEPDWLYVNNFTKEKYTHEKVVENFRKVNGEWNGKALCV